MCGMAVINACFADLSRNYLFAETATIAKQWEAEHPGENLIRMGVGDVALPIIKSASEAMESAARAMSTEEGFHGYSPGQGYCFLRKLIAENDYGDAKKPITSEDIFVSDGAKSDCGGLLDLFSSSAIIGLCDPGYPAYAEAAALHGMAGEFDKQSGRWSRLVYLPCRKDNDFLPEPPSRHLDIVYLCSPNNPSGIAMPYSHLKTWIDWANKTGAVIIFDAAYKSYIMQSEIPHTIYQVEGAAECAIEIGSFSKGAGFTGVRCSYSVIPKQLVRDGSKLQELWRRRQSARFNGVSYITQCGAAAAYSAKGKNECREQIDYYLRNTKMLRSGLSQCGFDVYGGLNAPYLWIEAPGMMSGKELFDAFLRRCAILTTPGAGFGPCGDKYVRISGFCKREAAQEAVNRIQRLAIGCSGQSK